VTILSTGVSIIDSVTKSLGMQAVGLKHKMFTGDGGVGDAAFKVVTRDAVVEMKQRQFRTFSGALGVSKAVLTFTTPVPITEFDEIYLPDGTGGKVLGVGTPVDASGHLIAEVYL
jgi:hypothetical protein